MTLQDSIRIGLDNSEIVRVIAFGAQGIPIGGFEPTPLNTGASAGVASSLGAGTLQSVYDPAIQETQIAAALATFDTAFTTSILWGDTVQPFNNGVQGGSLSLTGTKYPIVSVNDSLSMQAGLSKQTETGGTIGIVHNVAWSYQNSSFLVWPSAYTTNLQLTLTQPLLGSAPLPGQPAGQTGRAGGQSRQYRDPAVECRRGRLAVQGRGDGTRSVGRAAVLEPGAGARSALEL